MYQGDPRAACTVNTQYNGWLNPGERAQENPAKAIFLGKNGGPILKAKG